MRLAIAALSLLALATPTLAHPPRPAADLARDAARKPAEMVAFARIVPGMTVADIIAGGGYFTRVFATAVGDKGKVVAIVPPAAAELNPADAKIVTALGSDPAYGNITVIPGLDPSMTGTLDVAWTAQNYHDLHGFLPPEAVAGFNKGVFAALKSGGVFVIVDHAAAAGSGTTATKTLHRIDPAQVKADMTAAGFVFDGESTALATPADPKTANVFDPAVRGKTDQFALRFRKP